MLDQENNIYFDEIVLTTDGRLACFIKYRYHIVWKLKGVNFFQKPQSSEEELVVRERATISTERTSVCEPGTNRSHVPIF